MTKPMPPRVLAIAAHPDDIEFLMAGTLLLLAEAGYEPHYLNIANGSCGSAEVDAETITAVRLEESRAAAVQLGAVFHPPFVPDIEILYERELLARVAAVVRQVAPEIVLTHSPDDYMEDHRNAARLAATAAFCRGMPNFPVDPPHPAVEADIAVYHAQPPGNRDTMNHLVTPDFFVDVGPVLDRKTEALSCHRSQKEWLDRTQGMDSYLAAMREMAREVGAMSGAVEFAEGWRKRNPLGLCPAEDDPLAEALANHIERPNF